MLGGDNTIESKSVKSKTDLMISRPLEILLRVFGIWPGASYSLFFKTFWLLSIVTIATFQYLYLIAHFRSIDLTVFMHAVSSTMALTAKFIKILIFWFYQRKFNDMWRTMSTNWQRDSDADQDATGKMQFSRRLPNLIVAFNSFSVIMWTYGVIATAIHYDEASNMTRPYIVMMHLPFESKNQSVYLLIIFLQFFYVLSFAAGAATLNSVLIILMLYLGDQIDVIRKHLVNMTPGENERDSSVIMAKEIVKKHQKVIEFSENIESLYTYIAFELLILNTIITCGLGFILATSIRMPNSTAIIARNLMFYCVINIETFVFCFAGEYISSKSREIGEAAYNSPWYKSKFHSGIVLFLIMRSQNQLTITMGKFMDLSLDLFTSILRIGGSYVSVLLAMY